MRVENQTHWMTKLCTFVISFVVLGASGALAETAVHQNDVNNHYQVSLNNYSLDFGHQMNITEFKVDTEQPLDWRFGVGVVDMPFISTESQTNYNLVLYFTSEI